GRSMRHRVRAGTVGGRRGLCRPHRDVPSVYLRVLGVCGRGLHGQSCGLLSWILPVL
ncbi:MAG: hypothetical protein AVDCRST_MAG03-42, partial [uncultured Rubrobacteraceae bacterium]